MNFDFAVNEKIRAREVRLVDGSGNQLGVMARQAALDEARRQNLDLVEINSKSVPPVCRILDYGKFRYDRTREEKERAKVARANRVETKEIQLRPVTDDNDLAIKAKRAVEFLESGDRVKVVIKFRGRELSHKQLGQQVMDGFLARLGDSYKMDKPAEMAGRQMIVLLAPVKKPTS